MLLGTNYLVLNRAFNRKGLGKVELSPRSRSILLAFRAVRSQTRTQRKHKDNERVQHNTTTWRRCRRHLSVDAPLGVCTFPVVKKISFENSSEGVWCVLSCVLRGVLRNVTPSPVLCEVTLRGGRYINDMQNNCGFGNCLAQHERAAVAVKSGVVQFVFTVPRTLNVHTSGRSRHIN